MGSGAHAGLVVEVPLHPGTLREEGHQLPGADQGGLYLAVVPSSASFIRFEIVSKCRKLRTQWLQWSMFCTSPSQSERVPPSISTGPAHHIRCRHSPAPIRPGSPAKDAHIVGYYAPALCTP